MLRQGFRHQYRAPVDRLNFLPPHRGQFRELSRFLTVAVHARAESGDWVGASRIALDMLHFGNDLPRGGDLLDVLTATIPIGMATKELNKILPNLDAAATRAALIRIERLEASHVTSAEILREEKWDGQFQLLQSLRLPNWRAEMYESWKDSEGVEPRFRQKLRFVRKRDIMDNYTHYMDALIAQARLPYALRKTVLPPNDPVSKILVRSFKGRMLQVIPREEAKQRFLLITFALHAYKLEHGQYPPNLNKLVPSYLKRIPRDPLVAVNFCATAGPARPTLSIPSAPTAKTMAACPLITHRPPQLHLALSIMTAKAIWWLVSTARFDYAMKRPITTAEKRLLTISGCSISLLLGVVGWRAYRDAEPIIDIPTPTFPSPNAFDYYLKAGQMHEAWKKATPGYALVDPVTDARSSVGLSPQQLAHLYPTAAKTAWIRKNATVLATVRQGFRYKYHSPLNRSPSTATFRFRYEEFHELARLLAIESHVCAEEGDWDGATQSALDILQLGHDTPRGGSLVFALDGHSLNDIGRKELRQMIPFLGVANLRSAALRMEQLEENRVPLVEVLQEEKWSHLTSLQENMRVPGWRSSFSDAMDWKSKIRMHLYSKRTFVDGYTRYIDGLMEQAAQPYTLRKPLEMGSDPLTQVIKPVLQSVSFNDARDVTDSVLLQTMFALQAYKLERGHFPVKLSELAPYYLKRVPLDPFGGGEAMRYRSGGDTYILYSIGPDGKDDRGKPIYDISTNPSGVVS
jgi:hypothetical protein